MRTLLKNCLVINGRKDTIVRDFDLYIQDGVIIHMGKNESEEGWQTVDMHHQYVMPGLINMHAHLFGSGRPSKTLGGGGLKDQIIAVTANRPGRDILDRVVYGNVMNALNAGVTTIRGVGDFHYSDVRVRDAINGGKLGPRLLVSGPAITCPTGHGDGSFAVVGSTAEQMEQLTQNNIDEHVDWIKICVTGGVMDATKKGEPGVVKMSLEQTKAVCDYAHAKGFRVASHTESTAGIKVALDGGVDTIEHGSQLTPDLIRQFKEQQAALICTLSPAVPLANLPKEKTMLDELAEYNSKYLFNEMAEGVRQALAAGLTVGLGTDASCPFVTQYGMYRELIYLNRIAGVRPVNCIHHATEVNASILGMADRFGTVEEGKQADLMVVENNPLDDLNNLRQPSMVVIGGRIINHPKVHRNAKIDAELDEVMKKL